MIPSGSAIVKQALVTVAGAVLAAWIVGQLPQVRDWMRRQWSPLP